MTSRPRATSDRRAFDYPSLLAFQCVALKLPKPLEEHYFAQLALGRLWRFDLAWPAEKLAIEVDGGGWIHGRHSRGQGLENDCEKFAEAAILGWTVLRVTPRQVKNGQASQWITRYLKRTRP